MDVADLRVKFSADTSDAERGIASIGKSIQGLGGGITQAGKMLSLGLTAPLLAVGAAAIATGTKLNAAMANIGSMGVATARVNELKKAIQDTSIEMGKTTDDLAKGTYQIISAFGDNADTIKSLQVNSKIAASGVAELRDVVNMTSIATKNWGDTSIEAQQHVGDLALKTVALGQVTLPELASSLGGIAPIAHMSGMSMNEMFTVIATASGAVGTTSEVVTELGSVIAALVKPNKDMAAMFRENGFASGEAMIKTIGFNETLLKTKEYSDRTGVSLLTLLKRKEAWKLLLPLTTTLQADYNKKLIEMGNAAGMMDEAYKKQTDGINKQGFALGQASSKWTVFLQNINDAIGGPMLAFMNLISPLGDKLLALSDTFKNLSPSTQTWIVGIVVAAAALGPLLIVVGSLTTALGAVLPVMASMIPAIGAIVAAFGLLYGAYQTNIFGFKDLVDNGFNRVMAAAPLAGSAIGELVDRLKYAGTNTFYTSDAIYKFTEALTGSKAVAKNVSETIVGLVGQIGNLQRVFNDAGGGANGFVAALAKLTGGTFKLEANGKIASIRWGDFVGVLDWSRYVFQIRWGDFIGTLSWNDRILMLKWGDFIAKFDWGNWAVSLRWGDYVGKLTWADVVTTFNSWDNYIEHLTWNQFVKDSVRWGTYIVNLPWGDYVSRLAWNSFVTSIQWGLYVTKVAWSDYIAPLTWRSILTVIDWNQYATKLIWSEFITKFTWTNVSTFNWSEFIPKLVWLNYVTPVGWLTYIAQLTWDTYVKPLSWTQFAEKLNWINYITPVGWLNYITVLTWDRFVPSASWNAFIEKLTWSNFVSSFSWAEFLEKLVWSSFIPSFSWANFITGIDLTKYVPAFPGWTAILSALGLGGSAVQGPPAPARGDPEVTFNPPTKIYIPGQASGTADFAGGWTWVGEKGPELLNLPAGSKILSNDASKKMIGHLADGNFTATPIPWNASAGQAITATPVAWKNSEDYLKKIADATTDNTRESKRAADVLVLTKKFTATPTPDIHGAFDKLSAAQIASATAIGKSLSTASIKNEQAAREIAGDFKGTVAEFKSFLQSVPGLFKTSSVTPQQMNLAKLGVPQNFADDWIRRLTDTVVHGVHWDGVDIKDAALRAGLDPSLPAKAILEMVTQKWNDQSLFADKKNLDLINLDAVKQAMAQQAAQKAGAANIMALFGIEPLEAQTQAKAAGQQARTALQQGFAVPSTTGVAGAASQTDIMSTLLGGATITPESVAPLAQSFIAAFASALTPKKDSTGQAAGVDFGAQIAASITASVTDSKAFEPVGPSILKKITDSWKTITNVDFVGGVVTAFTAQLGADSSVEALKNVGGKIAKLIKLGIDEYFKDASLVDSVKSSLPSKPPVVPVKVPGNALGTSYWRGGLSWVGEHGPELLNLPRGSQVFSNSQSMAMAGAGGGDINVYINATVDNRLDLESLAYTVAQKIRQRGR